MIIVRIFARYISKVVASTVASCCTIIQYFGSSISMSVPICQVPLYSKNTCSGWYSVFTFFKKSSVKSASLSTMTSFTLFFSSSSSVNSASPSSQQMTRLFPSFAKPCSNKVSLMREVFPLSIKPVNKYTGISFIYILPY